MKTILVSREKLIELWKSLPRHVPTEVMLTTAELESGCGEGLYNAVAERYERALHNRKGGSVFLYISFGLFQIMGFNLETLNFPDFNLHHENAKDGQRIDEYILSHMQAYDTFMGKLLDRYGIPDCFERYNGSGPMARAYLQKALPVYAKYCHDLDTQQGA